MAGLRCLAEARRDAELASIALEAAPSGCGPRQGALGEPRRDLGLIADQGAQDLAIPGLGVLAIEGGVQREVLARVGGDAAAPQPVVDLRRAARRGQLD